MVLEISEKIVFTRVHDYFCDDQCFYEHQYGLRKWHSAEVTVLE